MLVFNTETLIIFCIGPVLGLCLTEVGLTILHFALVLHLPFYPNATPSQSVISIDDYPSAS